VSDLPRLSGAEWRRMNLLADRLPPYDRGRFIRLLALAIGAHLDASGRCDTVGIMVAAELGLADALATVHGARCIEPVDRQVRFR